MRLPIAIFIILILVLLGASSVIFYTIFTTHVHGDYFRLETTYLDVDFPKNWVAYPWEEKNSTGDKYGVMLGSPTLRASMFIVVYDEMATKTYLRQNNLTDAFSATVFESKRLYNWTLQENVNATLCFVENGTVLMSGYVGNFSTLIIKGGYVDDDGTPYNWTWTFMSFVGSRVFQVAYHGVGEDYYQSVDSFRFVLNSTRIK